MPFKNAALITFLCIIIIFPATPGKSNSERSLKSAKIGQVPKPIESNDPKWGVEIGRRYARTPFIGKNNNVKDIIPMFYYEGDLFFVRGVEGGAHLWNNDQIGLDLFTRYRFFDYPEELDNSLNHNTFDTGLRTYWMLSKNSRVATEILTDFGGRVHGTARLEGAFSGNHWWLSPLLEIRGKTSSFNSRYYGLGIDSVDGGIDMRAALKSRLHVWRNLHFAGSVEVRQLESATEQSAMVNESREYMAYIGIGFFEEPKPNTGSTKPLNAKPYIRLAQGWGNDSTLAQIFNGNIRKEDVDVNMTSIFYGHPLSDTVFGLPIELYLTSGIVHHYSSSAQDAATELVLGFKFYYTIPIPWRIRLGATEGISYIDSFTYYEENSLTADGHNPSRLLNYLGLSIDLNLGDVFCSRAIEAFWLGYGIHHRSGIGGTSPTFGNISGGSNYNTLYLQWSGKF